MKYETNSWGKSSSSVSLSVTGRYSSIIQPVEIKLLNQKLSTSCIFHGKISLRPNSLWENVCGKHLQQTSSWTKHWTLTHTPTPSPPKWHHGHNRWWGKRTCTHLLLWELQNYNSLMNNHQQENTESHQKRDTPHPRSKEKPQEYCRGHCLRSKGSNKTLCALGHREPRDWGRPSFQCLSVSSRNTGQEWPATGAEALGAADLSHTACGISPIRGGCH